MQNGKRLLCAVIDRHARTQRFVADTRVFNSKVGDGGVASLPCEGFERRRLVP